MTLSSQLVCRGRCGICIRGSTGFTLVELMIVVAIIGVLSAIAVPLVKQYQITSYKGAAKAVLLEAASRQEQFVIQNRGYITGVAANDFSQLGMAVPDDVKSAYTFTITQPVTTATDPDLDEMPTFRVTATPVVGSVQDGQPTLSINQFGLRMPRSEW